MSFVPIKLCNSFASFCKTQARLIINSCSKPSSRHARLFQFLREFHSNDHQKLIEHFQIEIELDLSTTWNNFLNSLTRDFKLNHHWKIRKSSIPLEQCLMLIISFLISLFFFFEKEDRLQVHFLL